MKKLFVLLLWIHMAPCLFAQKASGFFAAQHVGDTVMWALGGGIIPSPKGHFALYHQRSATANSIWQHQVDVKVRAYPNPMTDVLHIVCPKNEKPIAYALCHMSGTNTGIPMKDNKMDVSSLEPGLYILSLTFEKGQKHAFKLIKR